MARSFRLSGKIAVSLFFLCWIAVFLWPDPVVAATMPEFVRLQSLSVAAPVDVALGGDKIYIAESAADRVDVVDGSGQVTGRLSGLAQPVCVAVGTDGRVVIGSGETGEVLVYDAAFNLLHRLGNNSGGREFVRPVDAAVADDGRVYVVDWGSGTVRIYNPDGTFSASLGTPGNGDGELHHPVAIAIDANASELLVLDRQLTLSSNGIWFDGARVQVFDMNGVFLRGFSLFFKSAGLMVRPERLAVDTEGRFYVTDSYLNVVLVYDSADGLYLGAVHDLDTPLRTPVGLTLSADNLLYIAARGTATVEVYRLGPSQVSGQ